MFAYLPKITLTKAVANNMEAKGLWPKACRRISWAIMLGLFHLLIELVVVSKASNGLQLSNGLLMLEATNGNIASVRMQKMFERLMLLHFRSRETD